MAPAVALSLAWSALVACACARVWASVRRPLPCATADPPPARPTLVVRPCAGDEPRLAQALRSTGRAVRSFPIAIRFAVASSSDMAYPVAATACDELVRDGLDARTVITGAVGPNRKADQIARVIDHEPDLPAVIIVADSDVDLADFSLDELVAPLAAERVAAAWSPPFEAEPRTFADRASAAVLDASLHSFALLSVLDRHGMVGKLFCVRTSALMAVGGMGGLEDVLGEDVELARRLRLAGFRTAAIAGAVRSLAQGRSLRQVVGRYARWIAVVRSQRPYLLPSYPLFFAAAPLLLVALAATAAHGAGAAAAVVVVCRLGAAWMARRASGRPTTLVSLGVDAALADALLLAAFARATTTRRVLWRGAALRLSTRSKGRRLVGDGS